tara:strand:+ start:479 stop:667 length:189 start_codon:yes stop_codon:yes gene_type:complete
MSGQTHLAVAYIGMIVALGIWTWTVFARGKNLEARIDSLTLAMDATDKLQDKSVSTSSEESE